MVFAAYVTATVLMISVASDKVTVMMVEPFRRIYYGLPSMSPLLVGVAYFISLFIKKYPNYKRWLVAVLAVFALNNLGRLPEHKRCVDDNGSGKTKYGEQRILALRNWNNPSYQVPDEIKRDLIYRAIRERL